MTDSDKMMMTSMLSGQEAMSGWLAAFLASDEDWNRLAESIDNCDGKAEEMAKIQLDNLAGDFTMLGSAWDAFQRSFVKGKASEGLRDFIQSVTDTLHQFFLVFLLTVRDNLQYIPNDTKIPVCPIHGVNQRHYSLSHTPIVLTFALLSLNGLLV